MCEQLSNVLEPLKNDDMSLYNAAINFSIPRKTLELCLKQSNPIKTYVSPDSTLSFENEKWLSRHGCKMWFLLTRTNTPNAGYNFFSEFLKRNQNIKYSKWGSLSISRLKGMNHNETEKYFNL